MHRHVKHVHHFFIPHQGNNYHPPVLHTKRAIFYTFLFLLMKGIIFLLVILLPLPVFVLPDVLMAQQQRLVALTNQVRIDNGRLPMAVNEKLNRSAEMKAENMSELNYFSHTGPQKQNLKYFLNSAGYKYAVAGENLAMGFSTAESVVAAWVKSPTHYSNLIDSDYTEFGVGLSGGYFDGKPTTYVAEHFGSPKVIFSGDNNRNNINTETKNVLGNKIQADARVLPDYKKDRSMVSWNEVENGNGIAVFPIVYIKGDVQTVYVQIGEHKIYLVRGSTDGEGLAVYSASTTLPLASRDLFSVVISPSLILTAANGTQILDTVPWQNAAVVSPTPVQKYILATNFVPSISGAVKFSRDIYIAFGILFSLALLIFIFVEVKQRRPHIVVQTMALIGLIVFFAIY